MKHFNVILLSTKLSDPASSSVATDAEVLAKKADEKACAVDEWLEERA